MPISRGRTGRPHPERRRARWGASPALHPADIRHAPRERARVRIGRATDIPELRRGEREHGVQLARQRRERRVAPVVGGHAVHIH